MYRSHRISVLVAVAALAFAFTAAAPIHAEAPLPEACLVAYDQCTANCTGLETRPELVSCLMGCDNTAARCTRDEEITLSSEEYSSRTGQALFAEPIFTGQAACHSTTACPAEYDSCGSWSSYFDCGAPYCGVYRTCGSGCGDIFCFGEAMRQNQERYRVCFNQQQEPCTEYQRILTVLHCGC